MGNQDEEIISNGLTALAKGSLKVAALSLLFFVALAALPVYAETGSASAYTDESLASGGFKPFSSLSSEPSHISDRVKIIHGRTHFILSNLNNFAYKPFHGQNMWIGEFAIPDPISRLEVVFKIGADSVIAVAGYRVIAEPLQPLVPPSPPPPPMYVPAPPPPMVYEPVNVQPWKPAFNVSLSFGGTYLNKDYWKPVDSQSTFSMTGDYNPGSWPVNLLVEFSYSDRSKGRWDYPDHGSYTPYVESQMSELGIGARRYLVNTGVVRPYLSLGVSSVSVDFWNSTSGQTVSDNSSSAGYFGDAGVIFVVHRLYMGLDLKVLRGTSVKLFGVSGDADYLRGSILFGFKF